MKNLLPIKKSDIALENNSTNENIDNTFVCRKIRIYPTKKQKQYFDKCFGASRYIYNNVVKYVNDDIKNRMDVIKNTVVYHKVHLLTIYHFQLILNLFSSFYPSNIL